MAVAHARLCFGVKVKSQAVQDRRTRTKRWAFLSEKDERSVWENIGKRDPLCGTSRHRYAVPKSGLVGKPDRVLLSIKNRTILDVGCGYGRNCVPLATQNQMVACDVSKSMTDRVRDVGIPFVQCDLRYLPFRTRSFDYLLNSVVLVHLPRKDVVAAIAELKRVGKRCLLIMPNPVGTGSFFGLLHVAAASLVALRRGTLFPLFDVPTFRGYIVNYYFPWRFRALLMRMFRNVVARASTGGVLHPLWTDRILYDCG